MSRSGSPTSRRVEDALLVTGFPYDVREHPERSLPAFHAFLTRAQGIRRDGSAALNACYTALGRFDGFWEIHLSPWDMAAGALMVLEAGGLVTDYAGEPFRIEGGADPRREPGASPRDDEGAGGGENAGRVRRPRRPPQWGSKVGHRFESTEQGCYAIRGLGVAPASRSPEFRRNATPRVRASGIPTSATATSLLGSPSRMPGPSASQSAPIGGARATATVLVLSLGAVLTGCIGGPSSDEIARPIAKLRSASRVGGERLVEPAAVSRFYKGRRSRPAWLGHAPEIVTVIRGTEADGLDPADYHLQAIESLLEKRRSERTAASEATLDVLLSDAVAGIADHVHYGRVRPSRVNPEWTADPRDDAPPLDSTLAVIAKSGSVRSSIEAQRPTHFIYRGLVAELARLRGIHANGGWPAVAAAGKPLKPGAQSTGAWLRCGGA